MCGEKVEMKAKEKKPSGFATQSGGTRVGAGWVGGGLGLEWWGKEGRSQN